MPTGHPDTTMTDLGKGRGGSPRGSLNKVRPATGHQAARQVRESAIVPMFYGSQPLLDGAYGIMSVTSDTTNMEKDLDTLLLQPRLTTMMRSADMANIAWVAFTQDDIIFIKTTDKTGAAETFSVTG